jgi:hypothetical protein
MCSRPGSNRAGNRRVRRRGLRRDGVELERHRVRSFEEMQEWGDDLSGFDLVVALSARKRNAMRLN